MIFHVIPLSTHSVWLYIKHAAGQRGIPMAAMAAMAVIANSPPSQPWR